MNPLIKEKSLKRFDFNQCLHNIKCQTIYPDLHLGSLLCRFILEPELNIKKPLNLGRVLFL